MRVTNAYSTWRVPPALARRIQPYLPYVRPLWAYLVIGMSRLLQWLRTLFLWPIWMSFEAYIAAWKTLEHIISRDTGIQVAGWHRTVFCLMVSLTVAQCVFMALAHVPLSLGTFALSLLHGLAIQVFWEGGRRWCKLQLGLSLFTLR